MPSDPLLHRAIELAADRGLGPLPAAAAEAVARGVRGPTWGFGLDEAPLILGDEWPAAVSRRADGLLTVAVDTPMPGVPPEAVVWWFAWHISRPQAYRLWHPRDHVSAWLRVKTDDLTYVGVTSFVEEWIGAARQELAISFRSPDEYGLPADTTAVCARVGFARRPIAFGHLIHAVLPDGDGSVMRSRFWLGDLSVNALNRRAIRRQVVPDRLGLDLLVHCAEEMAHLAGFLGELYAGAAHHP